MKRVSFLLAMVVVLISSSLKAQDFKSKTDDIKRSALVLIETQNEWMHPQGNLYSLIEDREMFNESVENIEAVLAYARKIGMPVIHCGLRFQKGHPELANGKTGLREAISRFGNFPTDDFRSQFYESLKPQDGEFIVTGRTGSSGFSGSNLDVFLKNNQIETVYLAGYATHVCVESTLREAQDKGYYPVMIEDACSAFNREQQEYVMKHVVHHFGEEVNTAFFTSMYNK